MGKATEDQLAVLHGKVAETMTAALEQSDKAIKLLLLYSDKTFSEGEKLPHDIIRFLEEAKEASPSLLTSVTKFLKDNQISCDPADNEKLADLQAKLKSKRRSNVTAISFD